jgi:hypothetical protein
VISGRLLVLGLAVLGALMVGLAQITGANGAKPHPLGTEVVVGHADASGSRTQIGLTVLAVRIGMQEELIAHGFRLDRDERDATPYYIDARFANKGPNAVRRALYVGLEDSEGDLIPQPLLFDFGNEPFEPCLSVSEGILEPGESYESCTLVLVPPGVDVGKVQFLSDNGDGKEPEFVYWATE